VVYWGVLALLVLLLVEYMWVTAKLFSAILWGGIRIVRSTRRLRRSVDGTKRKIVIGREQGQKTMEQLNGLKDKIIQAAGQESWDKLAGLGDTLDKAYDRADARLADLERQANDLNLLRHPYRAIFKRGKAPDAEPEVTP
jgi:hypothetical protein